VLCRLEGTKAQIVPQKRPHAPDHPQDVTGLRLGAARVDVSEQLTETANRLLPTPSARRTAPLQVATVKSLAARPLSVHLPIPRSCSASRPLLAISAANVYY
jgi:hypothetical protein